MTDEFKARWFNTSGVLQREDTDYVSLSYRKIVNAPGLVQLVYSGDHPLIATIADKWTVEIWRRNADLGVDWVKDFDGVYRTGRRRGADPGLVTLIAPGQLHRLSWRHILWYAGMDNRSEFVNQKAETVMKTLVTYNATSSASTANGRLRAGSMSEISVQTDGANGSTVSHYCAYEELLKSLQRLAPVAGGDFDLVKTAATTYQFRWYTGQLGTDRTATVVFSVERSNMGQPYYIQDHILEKTVALVAGQDQGRRRETVIRTGDDYHVTTNNIETYVDARNIKIGDTTGLNSAGDAELDDLRVDEIFTFDVLQTPSSYYGLHYFLGDLVTAINPFTGSSVTKKIDEIALTQGRHGDITVRVYLADA